MITVICNYKINEDLRKNGRLENTFFGSPNDEERLGE